jgi:transposase
MLKRKSGRMLLFLDRSKAHKNREVERWLKANKKTVKVKWFPIARPELNPVEECWNLLKDELTANRLYSTFEQMKRAISKKMRTKRFKLNMINYLC